MAEPINYLSAFMIGLLGGAHCVGMCGGIVGALTFAVSPEQRGALRITPLLLGYNLGRILSYTLAGALFGLLGGWLAGQHTALGLGLRIFAGLMLIAMGLYMAGWWFGLVRIEGLGRHLWKRLQPLGQRLLPVRTAGQALLYGMVWGWLPCGLVYSVLVWSASAASLTDGALLMASFGLGTLPAMLATGYFAQQLSKLQGSRPVRRVAGVLLILFGLWTLPLDHLLGSGHHAHEHHAASRHLAPEHQPGHAESHHSAEQPAPMEHQHGEMEHDHMEHHHH